MSDYIKRTIIFIIRHILKVKIDTYKNVASNGKGSHEEKPKTPDESCYTQKSKRNWVCSRIFVTLSLPIVFPLPIPQMTQERLISYHVIYFQKFWWPNISRSHILFKIPCSGGFLLTFNPSRVSNHCITHCFLSSLFPENSCFHEWSHP